MSTSIAVQAGQVSWPFVPLLALFGSFYGFYRDTGTPTHGILQCWDCLLGLGSMGVVKWPLCGQVWHGRKEYIPWQHWTHEQCVPSDQQTINLLSRATHPEDTQNGACLFEFKHISQQSGSTLGAATNQPGMYSSRFPLNCCQGIQVLRDLIGQSDYTKGGAIEEKATGQAPAEFHLCQAKGLARCSFRRRLQAPSLHPLPEKIGLPPRTWQLRNNMQRIRTRQIVG